MTNFFAKLGVSARDGGDVGRRNEAVHADEDVVQRDDGVLCLEDHGVEGMFDGEEDIGDGRRPGTVRYRRL